MSYIFQNLLLMYIYQSFNCVRSMCIETVSIQSVLHGYIIRKIPHKFSHKRTVTTYPQIVCYLKKIGQNFLYEMPNCQISCMAIYNNILKSSNFLFEKNTSTSLFEDS